MGSSFIGGSSATIEAQGGRAVKRVFRGVLSDAPSAAEFGSRQGCRIVAFRPNASGNRTSLSAGVTSPCGVELSLARAQLRRVALRRRGPDREHLRQAADRQQTPASGSSHGSVPRCSIDRPPSIQRAHDDSFAKCGTSAGSGGNAATS
jgi:hypothetical protein